MKFKRYIILLALGVCSLGTVRGEQGSTDNMPQVKATLTPDSVAIGDQFVLRVEILRDVTQQVILPEFEGGKIFDRIEIIREGALEFVRKDGRQITESKDYLLTTFDEGVYSLGRFPALYLDKNIADTIRSVDSLVLTVSTFAIDTTQQKIYDIVPPIDSPLKFGEFSGYLFGGLGLVGLIALLVILLVRYKRHKRLFGRGRVMEPPHIIAIRELEKLNFQKLWQNNKHKQYYTGLTDILREYIEARYSIHAMEMTSDEIVQHIDQMALSPKSAKDLEELLSVSDFVKFAKYVPGAEQNEKSYLDAYYFIEETKIVEPTKVVDTEEDTDPKEEGVL